MTTTSRTYNTVESEMGHPLLLDANPEQEELYLDDAGQPQSVRKRPRFLNLFRRVLPGWLYRRGWLLLLSVVAGLVGGYVYGGTAHTSYEAQVLLAVPSGASDQGPGNANDAVALALDYAAVLGNETDILAPAAQQLGIGVDQLKHRISVSVETGTAVLQLRYTAPTEEQAVVGVNEVATAIGQVNRANSVIPSKTLDVVEYATSANPNGTVSKHGAEIGIILGLLVGGLLVLIAERVDPRADTSEDISEVFNQPTVAVPGELTSLEFAHAMATAAAPETSFTLAPLRGSDLAAAGAFQRIVHADATVQGPTWTVSDAIEERAAHRLPSGAVILVVKSGERMRTIGDALERIRLMGTSLVWVLLLDRHDPIS
jgi:capsular polysaccharide biosynthesis protein